MASTWACLGGEGQVMPADRGPLRAEHRRLLLWVGRAAPRYLRSLCETHRIEVRVISPTDVAGLAPYARFLAIEVRADDNDVTHWAPPVMALALDHGLAVGLLMPDEDDDDMPELREAEFQRYFEQVKAIPRDPQRVRALYCDAFKIANWVRDFAPGPGANLHLNFGETPVVDPTECLLFQRAFHDCGAIRVQPLGEGMSRARVWQVWLEPAADVRPAVSFVAKIDARSRIEAERSNAGRIGQVVGVRRHAPIDVARSVDGYEHSLVVYHMMERAESFRTAVIRNPASVMADLFANTLRGLYAGRTPAEHRLSDVCRDLGLLRESAALDAAARDSATGVGPFAVVQSLESLPPIMAQCAIIHGDPHAGNLFVAGGPEVVLIDYGSVRYAAPVVADAACLEVSLAFPAGQVAHRDPAVYHNPAAVDWLPTAYAPPLCPPRAPPPGASASWLASAIEEIRMHVSLLEPNPAVYPVLLAANLFRHASYSDNGTPASRALAYRLGVGLVAHTAAAVGGGTLPAAAPPSA